MIGDDGTNYQTLQIGAVKSDDADYTKALVADSTGLVTSPIILDNQGGGVFIDTKPALTTGVLSVVAIGSGAGGALTSGDEAVMVGVNAGATAANGTQNTVVGYNADVQAVADSQVVVVGHSATADTLGVALGYNCDAPTAGIAIGANCSNTTANRIKLGTSTQTSLQIEAVKSPSGTQFLSVDTSGVITPSDAPLTTMTMGEIYTETETTVVGSNAGFVEVTNATTLSPNRDPTGDWDSPAAGRLRYIGSGMGSMPFHAGATISYKTTSGNNQQVEFYLAKNGVKVTGSKVLTTGDLNDYHSTAVHVFVPLATNDYISLFCTNNSGANDVVVNSFNVFAVHAM